MVFRQRGLGTTVGHTRGRAGAKASPERPMGIQAAHREGLQLQLRALFAFESGAGEESRTLDLRFTKPLLCH